LRPKRAAETPYSCERFYIDPRAFRSGALGIAINPMNGWLNSKIRKIAHAADKANSERQVNTVTFQRRLSRCYGQR
jgi:hypothetical protein